MVKYYNDHHTPFIARKESLSQHGYGGSMRQQKTKKRCRQYREIGMINRKRAMCVRRKYEMAPKKDEDKKAVRYTDMLHTYLID